MTPATINAALPGAVLRDTVVRGLQMRVFDKGRAWYLSYRTKGGRRRKPKIGDWPDLAIPKARKIARDMLDEVAAGKDPQGQRETDRRAPTMADLADRYMTEHGNFKKSKRDDARLIRLYIKPRLGTDRVAELDLERISKWHKGIASKIQANRALALLSKMLNLAEGWRIRPINSNPCRFVKHNKENKRRRYISIEEAQKVGALLAQHADERPQAVAFLYLLIYTGARRGEIAKAKWANLNGDVITLLVHKADQTGEPRTIHLPEQVMAVINRLPRTKTGTICGISSPYKTWYTIRKAAGCEDLRMHDLRHSFASACLAAGYTLAQIGELLGHQSAQTTKRYAHLMEEVGRTAAQSTADLIAQRMAVKPPSAPAQPDEEDTTAPQ